MEYGAWCVLRRVVCACNLCALCGVLCDLCCVGYVLVTCKDVVMCLKLN